MKHSNEKSKFKDIYDKINGGDPLTDKELTEGIRFFSELYDNLLILGPEFKLVAREIYSCLNALETFKQYREN